MADDEGQVVQTSIYVYPTVEGQPPRARVEQVSLTEPLPDDIEEGGVFMVDAEVMEMQVIWSRDAGTWVNGPNAIPLPADMADAITAHAKDLGVEW